MSIKENFRSDSKLSIVEQFVIRAYTGNAYSLINGILRTINGDLKTKLLAKGFNEIVNTEDYKKPYGDFIANQLNIKDYDKSKGPVRYRVSAAKNLIDPTSPFNPDFKASMFFDYVLCICGGLLKIDMDSNGLVQRTLSKKVYKVKEGDVISDNAFVSTTSNLHLDFVRKTSQYMMQQLVRAPQMIRIKRLDQSKGRDVSKLSLVPGESEILFPPFTKFCVNRVVIKQVKDMYVDQNQLTPNDNTREIIYVSEMNEDNNICKQDISMVEKWPGKSEEIPENIDLGKPDGF
jgi:hypothetical protein